jgi:glycerol kinase
MKTTYVLALDAGTTSSRAILFDVNGGIKGAAQLEFPQIYPEPGWVEHNPQELWETQLKVAQQVMGECGVRPSEIDAIGITNQRETTLIWNKNSGKPLCNAIVWQDRRTAPICEELKTAGYGGYVRENTGLIIDAYFSATKIAWILENTEGAREAAHRGELLFGTIDTWLVWQLTGGKVHATDVTNASRTMLYNINTLCWDETLLGALDIPYRMLPAVKSSGEIVGTTLGKLFDGVEIPIGGIAGDQQAALFGQTCFEPGMVKSTYGTGSFILMNTGNRPVLSKSGLLSTIAWGLNNKITYALEGSVFVTGAAIQWLRDELGLIDTAAESEVLSRRVEDTGGVYVVPAFTGLGAPYWDMYARGAIVGLTRGSSRNHIVRATLESLAYQVRDVLECMIIDSDIKIRELKVDGGASVNNLLMQFQADILGAKVVRPAIVETTAWGAACLAGLSVGFWSSPEDLVQLSRSGRTFTPALSEDKKESMYSGWKRAVSRAGAWVEAE